MDRESLNAIQGKPDNSVRRGEIYYVSRTKQGVTGSEIMPGRPAIIVSNDSNNLFSPTVEVVYLTTKEKADIPTHVVIDATKYRSVAMCEQITSVSKERLGTFVNVVSDEEMKNIDEALLISLALDTEKKRCPDEDEDIVEDTCDEKEACDDNGDESVQCPADIMKIIVERDTYKKLYEELLNKVVK